MITTPKLFWLATPSRTIDAHVGFRGTFTSAAAAEVEVHVLGSGWYAAHMDGRFLIDGPPRFDAAHPQHSVLRVVVPEGRHMLAIHHHHLGVETRILPDLPPFVFARVLQNGSELEVQWRASELPAYAATGRRSSPLYGWIEWVDTRLLSEWEEPHFDDSGWQPVVTVHPALGPIEPLETAEVRHTTIGLSAASGGYFREVMPFYELDDPPIRFSSAELGASAHDAEGVWRRYDLDRVRLGTPQLTLDLPPGAIVEIGSSELLASGRVYPVYSGSLGPTCNVDHFTARGGVQEFRPLHPKGMRFFEVHVRAAPGDTRFLKEEFVERSYFGDPVGSLMTGDTVLDRIWAVTMDTLRACSEDALVDCPTRERGQWLGDVAAVGMEIASVGYDDLRLFARGLRQSTWSAFPDGMLAGLFPGHREAMTTYSLQAISAVLRYVQITGDIGIARELLPALERSLAPFAAVLRPQGLDISRLPGGPVGGFVDWGYVSRPEDTDMALNLHALLAIRDLRRLGELVNRSAVIASNLEDDLASAVSTWLTEQTVASPRGWEHVGYHCAVLALRAGLVPPEQTPIAISFLKDHMLSCFPNDPNAPRLRDPFQQETRLITPYFAHYAMPELIERGEMDFVLDQYRRCWGWMLDQGATTLLEVFDTGWSRCHQWAGAPAWQMSRYLLGLWPRFDRGALNFDWKLIPGSLAGAEGTLPLPQGNRVRVAWTREGQRLNLTLDSSTAISVTGLDGRDVPFSHFEGQVVPPSPPNGSTLGRA